MKWNIQYQNLPSVKSLEIENDDTSVSHDNQSGMHPFNDVNYNKNNTISYLSDDSLGSLLFQTPNNTNHQSQNNNRNHEYFSSDSSNNDWDQQIHHQTHHQIPLNNDKITYKSQPVTPTKTLYKIKRKSMSHSQQLQRNTKSKQSIIPSQLTFQSGYDCIKSTQSRLTMNQRKMTLNHRSLKPFKSQCHKKVKKKIRKRSKH